MTHGRFVHTPQRLKSEADVMVCLAKKINAQDAEGIGMVSQVSDGYLDMIRAAVTLVHDLQEELLRITEGPVDIPDFPIPDEQKAGKLLLSKEGVFIILKTFQSAAAEKSLSEVLEIYYNGSGEIACTNAAKEGITAFLQKRQSESKN